MSKLVRLATKFAVVSCAGLAAMFIAGQTKQTGDSLWSGTVQMVAEAQAQSHSGGSKQGGGKHAGGAHQGGKKGGSKGKHAKGGHDKGGHDTGTHTEDSHDDGDHISRGKKKGASAGAHSDSKHTDHDHSVTELTGGSDIEENVFRHSGSTAN